MFVDFKKEDIHDMFSPTEFVSKLKECYVQKGKGNEIEIDSLSALIVDCLTKHREKRVQHNDSKISLTDVCPPLDFRLHILQALTQSLALNHQIGCGD